MESRHYTNKLLELVECGVLDKDYVILALVKWMSEDDVKECCKANEFFNTDNEED